jgi:hypothetical protein
MRAWTIALIILVALAPGTFARQAVQDQTALDRLPSTESIGPGWSVLTADAAAVTDLASAFRDLATANYGGPNGARAYVVVLLVAEGMTAVRDAWELSNGYFDNYRLNTDYEFDSEESLEGRPLPEGCADARRTFGTDEVLGEVFPVGISLCAADPDMIILAYASGEVDGQTGYLASDRLVELVLEHRAAGTPSPS